MYETYGGVKAFKTYEDKDIIHDFAIYHDVEYILETPDGVKSYNCNEARMNLSTGCILFYNDNVLIPGVFRGI